MNDYTKKNLKDTHDKIIHSESEYIGGKIAYYTEQLLDQKELYTFRQEKDKNYINNETENRIEYYAAMIEMLKKLQSAINKIDVLDKSIRLAE